MPPQPKSEEEKKATKSKQNARYYSRHSEALKEKARERRRIQDRQYDPEEYNERKVRRNQNALDALHSVSHAYIQPITHALIEMNIAQKLYKNEMLVLEDVISLLNVFFNQRYSRTD